MAEADIIGIRNFDETKDVVMSFVKGTKPIAVEAAAEPVKDINNKVLEELRRIRKSRREAKITLTIFTRKAMLATY